MKHLYKLLIILMFFPISVKAIVNNIEYDYVIDNYHININVNEDNTYDVEETIDVTYNYAKRSIYRRIPLYNSFPRLDGKVINNKIEINSLKVNEEYEKTISNKDLIIKVNNSNKSLESSHYVFNYVYNNGPDKIRNADEFIFNIVGSDWDTTINNITFKITFPKPIKKENITILQGKENKLSSENIEYSLNNNTISGTVKKINKPSEYVYASIILEDNYFVNAKYTIDYKFIIMFIIPTILTIISILIWRKYGKDEKLSKDKIFKISKYNSLETEYLYYGSASKKGICSLLFDLLNKGHLKINIIPKEESMINKEEYKIEIIDSKGLNANELLFINGLLKCKKEHTLYNIKDNEILLSDLNNNFYNTIFTIEDNINNKMNHTWLFEKRTKETILTFILMVISLITIVSIPILKFTSFYSIIIITILILIYMPFFSVLCISRRIDIGVRVSLFSFLITHLFIMFSLTPLYDSIIYDTYYLAGFIYGLICIVLMFICLTYMSKRTQAGTELLKDIYSFRYTLLNISKEELNSIIKENPLYYYQIIPYIYVLNITDYVNEKIDNNILSYPKFMDLSDKKQDELIKYLEDFITLSYEMMTNITKDKD